MERKTGTLRSWNTKRGFGIVRVGPESSLERYFLHINNIRSGTATPDVGSAVEFEVGGRPPQEGQLPQAIRADVILPEEERAAADATVPTIENDGQGGVA